MLALIEVLNQMELRSVVLSLLLMMQGLLFMVQGLHFIDDELEFYDTFVKETRV